MIICKECGVELDDGMEVCPLCDTSVIDGQKIKTDNGKPGGVDQNNYPQSLKQILWQIASVLLLSGILATLVINLSIDRRVTWSIYPITICLVLLSYASFMALWRVRLNMKILAGWTVSIAILLGIESFRDEGWPAVLALPILCAVNIICLLILLIVRNLKVKGLNVLAIMLVSVAVLCMIVEGAVSLYLQRRIFLSWSVIVSACLLPVTAAVIFMYVRTRNNRNLQKIFHT